MSYCKVFIISMFQFCRWLTGVLMVHGQIFRRCTAGLRPALMGIAPLGLSDWYSLLRIAHFKNHGCPEFTNKGKLKSPNGAQFISTGRRPVLNAYIYCIKNGRNEIDKMS